MQVLVRRHVRVPGSDRLIDCFADKRKIIQRTAASGRTQPRSFALRQRGCESETACEREPARTKDDVGVLVPRAFEFSQFAVAVGDEAERSDLHQAAVERTAARSAVEPAPPKSVGIVKAGSVLSSDDDSSVIADALAKGLD